MISKIFAAFLTISFCNVYADVLPKDSPERKQLIAMGYTLEDLSSVTIARVGLATITFDKNEERLAITREYSREKQLNKDEELELLQIINELNNTYSYQIRLLKSSLAITLYQFGNYDSQVFAMLVRLADKVDTIWDTKPRIYKLINK
jgi:hypothetical protein